MRLLRVSLRQTVCSLATPVDSPAHFISVSFGRFNLMDFQISRPLSVPSCRVSKKLTVHSKSTCSQSLWSHRKRGVLAYLPHVAHGENRTKPRGGDHSGGSM